MNLTKMMYVLLSMVWPMWMMANNISVTNTTLTGNNKTDKYIQVKFDITWENAWRTSSAPNNWDAAWIFMKYKERSSGKWKHAKLSNDGHVAPNGSAISTGLVDVLSAYNASTNPAVGVFLYPSADFSGTFSATSVEVRWNYGDNGLTKADYAEIEEVKVFAIEMVYIPTSSFYLGSGATILTTSNIFNDASSVLEAGAFRAGGTSNSPFQVTSENQLNIADAAGSLFGTNTAGGGGALGTSKILDSGTSAVLPADYPKGYRGFYAMKHEISQSLYADFLNTLTLAQQSYVVSSRIAVSGYNVYAVTGASYIENRNSIRTSATLDGTKPLFFYNDLNGNNVPNESGDGLFVPSTLRTIFLLAFLDWAALRPMSELEFEKAGKGPASPTAGAFAWGTSTGAVTANDKAVTDSGFPTELPAATANYTGNGFVTSLNIMRIGAFARSSSTRTLAGASYYGVLELSGNLSESVIHAYSEEGRNFKGKIHGDGELIEKTTLRQFDFQDTDAMYNAEGWPRFGYGGIGSKGGTPLTVPNRARISDRGSISLGGGGGRGVRSIPQN